jgi:hypothetical protein
MNLSFPRVLVYGIYPLAMVLVTFRMGEILYGAALRLL